MGVARTMCLIGSRRYRAMTRTSSRRAHIRLCALLTAAAVGASLRPAGIPVAHAALPPVTVTGVAANNSSVTIDFNPVPGAADYRVFDTANPMTVKYAGMVHLDAGVAHHFVVQ